MQLLSSISKCFIVNRLVDLSVVHFLNPLDVLA